MTTAAQRRALEAWQREAIFTRDGSLTVSVVEEGPDQDAPADPRLTP